MLLALSRFWPVLALACLLWCDGGLRPANARVVAYYPFNNDGSVPWLVENCESGPPITIPQAGTLPTAGDYPGGIIAAYPLPNGWVSPPCSLTNNTVLNMCRYDSTTACLEARAGGLDLGTVSFRQSSETFSAGSVSVSVWINVIDKSSPSGDCFFNKEGQLQLRISENKKLIVQTLNGFSLFSLDFEFAFAENTWNHVVFTYAYDDGSPANSKASVYLNGVLEDTITNNYGPYNDGSAELQIGYTKEATDKTFLGLIDDLVVFNEALTQTDVQAIYNQKCLPSLMTVTSDLPLSFVDSNGRNNYVVSVGDVSTFNALFESTWDTAGLSACSELAVPVGPTEGTSTYQLEGLEPGQLRVDACRDSADFVVSGSQTYSEIYSAVLLQTNILPVIVNQLPETVESDAGVFSLEVDVKVYPANTESYTWEYLSPNNSSKKRRTYAPTLGDCACHAVQPGCRCIEERWLDESNAEVAWLQSRGNGTNTTGSNGTWVPFANSNSNPFSLEADPVLEGVSVRVVIDNLVGQTISNSTTLRIGTDPSGDADGVPDEEDGGDGLDLAAIAGGAAGGLVVLACCCVILLLCCALLLIAAVAVVAGGGSTAYMGYKGRERVEAAKSSILREMDAIWDIPYSELEFEKQLGAGAFGSVYLADWHGTEVAVKKLDLSATQIESFKDEAELMKKMRPHPNVIQLYGVCTDEDTPACIIMEYLKQGDVLRFLLRNAPDGSGEARVPLALKIQMAYDVAVGMAHLSREGIVHSDLAARNLLLTDGLRVKVADFGMSSQREDQHDSTDVLVGPIRWMPPELLCRALPPTERSDVYSYGITMWEIFSDGQKPYPHLKVEEVAVAVVTKGLRPIFNDEWPYEVRKMMEQCWGHIVGKRPSFSDIVTWWKKSGLMDSADVGNFSALISHNSHTEVGDPPSGLSTSEYIYLGAHATYTDASSELYRSGDLRIPTEYGLTEYSTLGLSLDNFKPPAAPSGYDQFDQTSLYGALPDKMPSRE